MDTNTVIEVNHISKKFSKNLNHLIKYSLNDISKNVFGLNPHSEKLRKGEFWAVNNISFKLKKGEALGLIGPNGSGKTTLLKMLNGILTPDKGEIKIKGRVGALIQVGAGFHPLLTGRENIYVNGAILGMTKKEIDRKFKAIIEFADIGDFLDAPVKTYSSGMFVRLGFAIAAYSEPDILLVDEILAVGDIAFQSKCFNKISQLAQHGTSLIIVSHNLQNIRRYAQKALFIKKGKLIFYGKSQSVCQKFTLDQTAETTAMRETTTGLQISSTRFITKIRFELNDYFDKKLRKIKLNQSVKFDFSFLSTKQLKDLQVGIIVYKDGLYLVGIDSLIDSYRLTTKKNSFSGQLYLPRLFLSPGNYSAILAITNKGDFLFRGHSINFSIIADKTYPGFIALPHHWKF